jgi:Ca2+-binding EF-hand superfamily protein
VINALPSAPRSPSRSPSPQSRHNLSATSTGAVDHFPSKPDGTHHHNTHSATATTATTNTTSHHSPHHETLPIKKNANGGIYISPEEIQSAFQMLDLEKNGHLTLATLKKRLGPLFPDMTAKEYRFLMNNKKELNIDDLKELLIDNELMHFDPIVDAFHIFDPNDLGIVDEDRLRTAFISFGLGELSDEELAVLKRVSRQCNNNNNHHHHHHLLLLLLLLLLIDGRFGWRWSNRFRRFS